MTLITDLPANSSFILRNATVPVCLVDNPPAELPLHGDGLARLDLRVEGGRIASLASPGRLEGDITSFELSESRVWPCFADVHTHIDKGHIWPRNKIRMGPARGPCLPLARTVRRTGPRMMCGPGSIFLALCLRPRNGRHPHI